MEVQKISQQLIKPSLPTPSHLQNMPISFFDQRLPPITVPIILYYLNHENLPINSPEYRKRLNLLKKSLSDILTIFYPFAGRYVKDSLSIRCEDQGVPYSEALVNVQISYIFHGRFQIHELNCLIDNSQDSDTNLLAVRINIFKCGGVAIGIAHSHRMFDAFTFCLFANAWAKACKTGHIDESLLPNFETGVLFPVRENSQLSLPPISDSKSQVVTERFVFKSNEKIMMSTSMVIAIIWRAQIKAARARHGFPRSSLLCLAVNLRGKTKKTIPENCCGNIYTNAVVRFGVEDHKKEMSLNVLAEKVRDSIKRKIAEFGETKEDVDEDEWLYKLLLIPTRELAEEGGKGEGDIHRFSSVRGFPFYEVDFGWGKPAWVSWLERPFNGVMIIHTKDGDGVEAWVTMDKQEMEYFKNDSNISSMSLKFGESSHEFLPVKIKSHI